MTHLEEQVEFVEGDVADAGAVAARRQGRGLRVSRGGAGLGAAQRRAAAGYARRLRDRHADRARRGPQGRRAAPGVCRPRAAPTAISRTSSKRETDLPAPISPYGAAKLAGELYCQAFTATYGFETVAIRYFNVFGPRQDPNSQYSAVIPLFITAMLAGRQPTIYGDGMQSRDFTYVANVVHGNLLAADADARRWPAARSTWPTAAARACLELIAAAQRVAGHQDRSPSTTRPASATCAKAWPTSPRPASGWTTSRKSASKKGCGARSITIADLAGK